ncbi:hypothetical protein PABG_12359 [Paracoccidioides brasiliensis Pb03]|nr:hypothetical protein PABG_12359 [Paracoccidioides brasiliensis Pb03]
MKVPTQPCQSSSVWSIPSSLPNRSTQLTAGLSGEPQPGRPTLKPQWLRICSRTLPSVPRRRTAHATSKMKRVFFNQLLQQLLASSLLCKIQRRWRWSSIALSLSFRPRIWILLFEVDQVTPLLRLSCERRRHFESREEVGESEHSREAGSAGTPN